MVGFLPLEFVRSRGNGDVKTLFLSDTAMVPSEIPANCLFIHKQNATLADFLELLTIFDASFTDEQCAVVIFALGTYDISLPEKQLEFNQITQTLDFHVSRNKNNRYISQLFEVLVKAASEFDNFSRVISIDPMARTSSGFHNNAVNYISRRVNRVCDKHVHLETNRRYVKDLKKAKQRRERFELREDRFDADGLLLESERQLLTTAALRAVESDTDVVVNDAFFAQKW